MHVCERVHTFFFLSSIIMNFFALNDDMLKYLTRITFHILNKSTYPFKDTAK